METQQHTVLQLHTVDTYTFFPLPSQRQSFKLGDWLVTTGQAQLLVGRTVGWSFVTQWSFFHMEAKWQQNTVNKIDNILIKY